MPTIKQEMVARRLVENGGNISKTMREVGYSPATAVTPSKLTGSKGWAELMEKYLPDQKLAKKHKEFLNTPRIRRTYIKGNLVEETEETDPNAVKALDLAYKIKGKYVDSNATNVGEMHVTVNNY